MASFSRVLLVVAALVGLCSANAQSFGNCNFVTIQTDLQTCLSGFSEKCLPTAGAGLSATVVDYCPYIRCVFEYTQCLLDLDCDIFTQATLESNYANLDSPAVKEALANCEVEVPAWYYELATQNISGDAGMTGSSGAGLTGPSGAGATGPSNP